ATAAERGTERGVVQSDDRPEPAAAIEEEDHLLVLVERGRGKHFHCRLQANVRAPHRTPRSAVASTTGTLSRARLDLDLGMVNNSSTLKFRRRQLHYC